MQRSALSPQESSENPLVHIKKPSINLSKPGVAHPNPRPEGGREVAHRGSPGSGLPGSLVPLHGSVACPGNARAEGRQRRHVSGRYAELEAGENHWPIRNVGGNAVKWSLVHHGKHPQLLHGGTHFLLVPPPRLKFCNCVNALRAFIFNKLGKMRLIICNSIFSQE